MNSNRRDLDEIIAQTERLGVIGSPSSTSQLALDVLGAATTRKLVGELALFRYNQEAPHYALGQITEVQLRNVWHEDPTMRSLIRQRGRVDAVSERQDTHQAKMTVSAVFKKTADHEYEPSILGTVPPTGTSVHVVTDEVLDETLRPYRDEIFYLGHVYGSRPRLPLWFKHFDSGKGGAGEAYHLGIFGKTGSGKSVLAKMILLAYSRHKEMALLVVDPQGEFARDMRGDTTGAFTLRLRDVAKSLGKEVHAVTLQSLVLDRWVLFEEILYESVFFERLSVPKSENRGIACRVLSEQLQKKKVSLANLASKDSFASAWQILKTDKVQTQIYRSDNSRMRFAGMLTDADEEEFYEQYWKPVANLFSKVRPGARTVENLLTSVLDIERDKGRPILVIDLSREQAGENVFWTDKIQALVIRRILQGIALSAEHHYKAGKSLNTLVIIDEAHRLAPRELARDDDTARDVRKELIDAARTTRKYGLGWLFISQTLSSIDMEILQQLRIFFFGFGLGLGQEFQALRQLVGSSDNALALYQLFRDPHSAFDAASRQYSFMTTGPVSPLSFSGTPLFFNAFNRADEFLKANNLSIGGSTTTNR